MSRTTRRIARSRLARLAAFPLRSMVASKYVAQVAGRALRWLVRSREHTNFTYDLTARNSEHLAWWVAAVTNVPVGVIREYMRELEEDRELRRHVESAVVASDRRGLADREVRFGRRAGWYALVRALRPDHVLETGTDKGLGTCVLAAAVLRNGSGYVTTIDTNPDSGYLITGRYGDATNRVIGDSVNAIGAINEPVDFFLHDSLHTFEHESAELQAVAPRLSKRAVVLSDNAHATDALLRWAEASDYRFLFFREVPQGHWYPGSGIGVAW